MALVLIDVDGTLLEIRHSEARFLAYLTRQGAIGPRQILAFVGFVLRFLPRYGRHVAKKDKAYLSGLSVAEVTRLAERFVRDELEPKVRASMRRRIQYHHDRGDTLALLTGTPDFLARALANSLDIPHVVATQCEVDEHRRYTARPPRIHPFGADKLEFAKALCRDQGVALADCIAYADSGHDARLLRSVGTPVAVHPDKRLAALAREDGWQVL